jgi:heavy metal translocating P-type ATPase
VQRLADRISAIFVPVVLLLGLVVTAAYLVWGSGIEQSITVGLTVILISCPCALGLAVPSAVLAACSNAAGRGIIIRGGDTLERLAKIDQVAFDKTGTLTEGKPCIESFELLNNHDQQQLLSAVASVEYGDCHPISSALRNYAVQQVGEQPVANGIKVLPGLGVIGTLSDGTSVVCGNRRLLNQNGIEPVEEPAEINAGGHTVVYVAINGCLAACFKLKDKLKDGAVNASEYFNKLQIGTTILSGDRQEVVNSIMNETGISSGTGGMVPDEKLAMVTGLQKQGKKVLMAGDGINDTPALAAASVGCVPAGSSDSALEQADIILSDGNIALLAEAHKISVRAVSVIHQNLLWAFLYNMIGIPLAVSGMLTPVFAAAAMTASSLMVSANSLRLLRGRHG